MKTYTHFGLPYSGYQEFSNFMEGENLSSTYVDDIDLLDLLATGGDVFIFMVHDQELCAWQRTLEKYPNKDRAQQVRLFHNTLNSSKFNPNTYKKVVKRLFNINVPTSPMGGIFFTRTPNKKIIMVLNWDDLSHNLPILEFVFRLSLDRWKFSSMRYQKTKMERPAKAMMKSNI